MDDSIMNKVFALHAFVFNTHYNTWSIEYCLDKFLKTKTIGSLRVLSECVNKTKYVNRMKNKRIII